MGEQYLSTSRLGNVMRLIALGRQTGLLRVVRGQGPSREEGEVQFVDGQIAMAMVGQLSGNAAVSVLQNWGESFYIFLDGVNRSQPGNTSNNLGWGSHPGIDSMPPSGSGSLPNGSYGSFPGYHSQPGYGSQPGYNSQPEMQGNMPPSGPIGQPFDSGALKQLPPHVAQRLTDYGYIPRRLTVINPTDMAALDRRERQLLLLVDNRRTIADLIRLTRRNDDELRYILAHLITLGLVE